MKTLARCSPAVRARIGLAMNDDYEDDDAASIRTGRSIRPASRLAAACRQPAGRRQRDRQTHTHAIACCSLFLSGSSSSKLAARCALRAPTAATAPLAGYCALLLLLPPLVYTQTDKDTPRVSGQPDRLPAGGIQIFRHPLTLPYYIYIYLYIYIYIYTRLYISIYIYRYL